MPVPESCCYDRTKNSHQTYAQKWPHVWQAIHTHVRKNIHGVALCLSYSRSAHLVSLWLFRSDCWPLKIEPSDISEEGYSVETALINFRD